MSTYKFNILLTDVAGLPQEDLVLTIVNIKGGISPISLTENGNGWYSNAAVPQGVYEVFKDVSGTPTTTDIIIDHISGVYEESNGYRKILDDKLKKEYKTPFAFGPAGSEFTSEAINNAVTQAVTEGVKIIRIPSGTYEMEVVTTIAEDDFILEGLGDVIVKYPAGITDADYALLKVGGGNCVFKNIIFDLTGIDNTNTTLGGIHYYHANAINSKFVDCVIKNRTGGPAVNLESGSFATFNGVKFKDNTTDIKARVATFNYLNLVNCEFENPAVIDNNSVIINSVNNKYLGNIGLKNSSDEFLIGCYFDGTNYRKLNGYNTAWRIYSTTGVGAGIKFREENIIVLADNAVFSFTGSIFSFLITGDIYTENSVIATQGIAFDSTSFTPGDRFITKVFEIGDWNMDADATKTVSISEILGTSTTYDQVIRSIQVLIKQDANAGMYDLNKDGYFYVNDAADLVSLTRTGAGFFDNTGYDATSYNRGFVTITYLYT